MFSVSLSLSWQRRKSNRSQSNSTIYFISFLDPQAAKFHFHLKWKGSGLLSELEKRVRAHLNTECVCLFNLLIGNVYVFISNIYGEPKDWATREQMQKDGPLSLNMPLFFFNFFKTVENQKRKSKFTLSFFVFLKQRG